MKKKLLVTMIIAMAVAAAACGKKADKETAAAVESTEANKEAKSEATTGASEETEKDEADDEAEEVEDEGYYQGTVTAINGKQITLQGPDGSSYVFDTANAETDPDYDVLPGALVDVSYDGAKSEVTPVTMVSVVMSLEQQADSLGVDPVLVGTVTDMTPSEITVTDPNGKAHEFSSAMAYVVAKSEEELNVGANVSITYVGTLDEPDPEDEGSIGLPIATKIVLDSMKGTEEANQNIVAGTINYVDPETNTFMIDGDALSFEFSCTADMINGLSEGNTVKVIYDGNLYNKLVTAVSVTPVSIVGTGR